MFKLVRRPTKSNHGLQLSSTAISDDEEAPHKEAAVRRQETTNNAAADTKMQKKKIGHRRVDLKTGLVTYKKVPTSQLMGAIQFGIANSIGALSKKPERDLLLQDFEFIESVYFPGEGTHTTPSHPYGDFRFKTYAPIAFRYFRDLFSILPEDFLASLCGLPLRELSNPGVSGSIFYISSDDKFIIKTVQRKEADFLQKLLPGYYMNLNQNPKTLLPKFFGLYCLQSLGKNVRFIVMNNLLPSTIKLHQKYDLKGSTYKRRASEYEKAKQYPTLKDLDLLDSRSSILLDSNTFDALMKTISRDCLVLKSFKIMDYSLLLGIHNMDQAIHDRETNYQLPAPVRRQYHRKVIRQKTVFSAWESIQTETAPLDLGDEYPVGGIMAHNKIGERLLLFLGIIDILQNYRLFKKMEHSWKSLISDGDTISVHHPNFYAARFEKFMSEVVFTRVPTQSAKGGSNNAAGSSSVRRRSQKKTTSESRTKASSHYTTADRSKSPTNNAKVKESASSTAVAPYASTLPSSVVDHLSSNVPLVDTIELIDRNDQCDSQCVTISSDHENQQQQTPVTPPSR